VSNTDDLIDHSILAKKQCDLLYAPIGTNGNAISNADNIELTAEANDVILTNSDGDGDYLVLT
jgi:hypothetical protein